MGYDQPEVINLYNNANPAAVLFQKVLSQVHVGLPSVSMYSSAGMIYTTVCLDSGKRATEACKQDVRTISSALARTESVQVYKEDVPGLTCDKHVLVDFCVECNAVANEYCLLFAEEGKCTVEKRALVKLTQKELDDIMNAKPYGLEPVYYDNSYVYLITDSGKDGDFKGFDGNANKNVTAPYIVATGHKKADWEEYKKGTEEDTGENTGESTDQNTQQEGTVTD